MESIGQNSWDAEGVRLCISNVIMKLLFKWSKQ